MESRDDTSANKILQNDHKSNKENDDVTGHKTVHSLQVEVGPCCGAGPQRNNNYQQDIR